MLSRLIHRYRQRLASVAMLALLLAQALSLAHGVAHPLSGSGLPLVTAASSGDAGNWADQLHDAGSAQCHALDQISHADALTPALSLPSLPPPAIAPAPLPRVVLCARFAPAYLARGPPRLFFA
jgi:hypothetical protein